jgi:dihydrofolate synthase/folylpolyglutamate synthase
MTYSQVIEYLFNQYPQFQKIGGQAYKPGLDNIVALCKIIGNPHEQLKFVHVAGTNGKGSTCNLLASVLQESGYKVGLFTSPHLVDFRERIRINGIMIPKEEVIAFVVNNKKAFEAIKASFFEWSTALAFHYFASKKVDIVVLETGLGGRLDSTNIVNPLVTVITQIGIDHTQFLGDTLEQIASEKAGIIKENRPCVLSFGNEEVENVFIEKAKKQNSQLTLVKEIPAVNYSNLLGDYQRMNIATVEATCKILSNSGFIISIDNISLGLKNVIQNTGFRGRWEVLQYNPTVIADIGHNLNGLTQIVKQLEQEKSTYKQIHIVFGMVADKDLNSIVAILPKEATFYLCSPKIQRALSVEDLAVNFQGFPFFKTYLSCAEAFKEALSTATLNDLIFVGGSNFVVAEIIDIFFNKSLEV